MSSLAIMGLSCAGLADPVYAEAYVTVHQYDIVLDVTVINRTSETLQNLCLELATMGDLKLVERPQNYTLSPQSSKTIRCSLISKGWRTDKAIHAVGVSLGSRMASFACFL